MNFLLNREDWGGGGGVRAIRARDDAEDDPICDFGAGFPTCDGPLILDACEWRAEQEYSGDAPEFRVATQWPLISDTSDWPVDNDDDDDNDNDFLAVSGPSDSERSVPLVLVGSENDNRRARRAKRWGLAVAVLTAGCLALASSSWKVDLTSSNSVDVVSRPSNRAFKQPNLYDLATYTSTPNPMSHSMDLSAQASNPCATPKKISTTPSPNPCAVMTTLSLHSYANPRAASIETSTTPSPNPCLLTTTLGVQSSSNPDAIVATSSTTLSPNPPLVQSNLGIQSKQSALLKTNPSLVQSKPNYSSSIGSTMTLSGYIAVPSPKNGETLEVSTTTPFNVGDTILIASSTGNQTRQILGIANPFIFIGPLSNGVPAGAQIFTVHFPSSHSQLAHSVLRSNAEQSAYSAARPISFSTSMFRTTTTSTTTTMFHTTTLSSVIAATSAKPITTSASGTTTTSTRPHTATTKRASTAPISTASSTTIARKSTTTIVTTSSIATSSGTMVRGVEAVFRQKLCTNDEDGMIYGVIQEGGFTESHCARLCRKELACKYFEMRCTSRGTFECILLENCAALATSQCGSYVSKMA